MVKAKTSKKLKKSSKKSNTRKNESKLTVHNPYSSFKEVTKEMLVEALVNCLMDGDTTAFKDVLRAYLSTKNKSQLVSKLNLSRKTLYNILSEDGNPTIETISKVLSAA